MICKNIDVIYTYLYILKKKNVSYAFLNLSFWEFFNINVPTYFLEYYLKHNNDDYYHIVLCCALSR